MPAASILSREFFDLDLLLVLLAQFLLDGLHLLAQEILALHLFHLALGFGLDLAAQLQHFQLFAQQRQEDAQLARQRVQFQNLLRVGDSMRMYVAMA